MRRCMPLPGSSFPETTLIGLSVLHKTDGIEERSRAKLLCFPDAATGRPPGDGEPARSSPGGSPWWPACASRRRLHSPGSASRAAPSGGGSAGFSRDLGRLAGPRGESVRREEGHHLAPHTFLPRALPGFHPRRRHRNLGKGSRPPALRSGRRMLWARRKVQPCRLSGRR